MQQFFSFLLGCALLAAGPLAAQQVTPNDATFSHYTYPFPVHYFNLSLQGNALRMAYMDVTPAQPNGRTIVLLHGKNFGGGYWDSTATALSREGFRVIVPDQIGFGKSDKPAHLPKQLERFFRESRRFSENYLWFVHCCI